MNITKSILQIYPDLDPFIDFIVENKEDGNGPHIAVWNSNYQQPTQTELESAWLQVVKNEKINEFDIVCEDTISTGFTSQTTGFFYRFNLKYDQMNFTQQYLLMISNPSISQVSWKTEDAGIINHTREQFFAVVAECESHKRNNIQKFWDLKAQVLAATTPEQVDSIAW